jgi:hypothetical protein
MNRGAVMSRGSVSQQSWVVGTLLLGLIASGCSTSGSASAEEETLASFMGWDDVDEAASEAQWREQDAEIQEAIRACMAEAGFEYTPVDQTGSVTVYDEQDEEERVRREGFGITTWHGELGESIQAAIPDEEEEFHDPNWDRVEAMSESEQQAYYEALHGSEEEQRENATIEVDPETGEEIGWSNVGFGGGCDGEAHEAAYGGDGGQDLWEELQPAFDEMYARVEADPRMVEHNAAWSACMAEAGFDHASAQQMHETVFEDFEARLEEILGPDHGFVDPFEGWSEADIEAFFEERTEDEIDAFFQQADQQQSRTIDEDALRALQQEEIDLAVADYECRDGDAFYELYEEISAGYEAEFIAENREALEQIRDAEGR